MSNIPFLYGELNKQVEYLKYKFQSTDTADVIHNKEDNTVSVSVNTTQLVTLKQVVKNSVSINDPIKYYALYAYNPSTKAYDTKLGDEIVVDTSLGDDIASIIKDVWIQVGEEIVKDDEGNIVYTEDEHGNKIPLMKPVYQKIETVVSTDGGYLQMKGIPVSALIDTHNDGQIIESVIDGNGGKGVY